jgi:hypothetical protein
VSNPDDEDNEDLTEWQRRMLIDGARKRGAPIGPDGKPVQPPPPPETEQE